MKKFSTLSAFLCSLLIASSASAQFSQSFNSATEVSALPSSCWQFKDFIYSGTDLSTGSGSMINPLSDSSYITTPLLNKPSGGPLVITLTYRVNQTKPGINALKVILLPGDGGAELNVRKLNVNTSDGITTVDFSQPASKVPTTFTVQIVALNIDVNIDDLSINTDLTPGGCTAPITLPVKLLGFAGSTLNNKAQLKWSVADNETGDHFQVLRSADGRNFSEAGVVFINAKVGAESYSFTDATELGAATFYQLKIVNKNGSIAYSNIITLKSTGTKGASGLSILQNPVAATLNFSYSATAAGQSNVAIYTTTGVKVYSSRLSSVKGANAVSLPLQQHLAAGTYILEITNGSERSTAKMVKQ